MGIRDRHLDFIDRAFVRLLFFALGLAVISLVAFLVAWAIAQF